MRIAVAGGTGAVGKYVVEAARQAGHEVVSISRRSGVDVRTGAGLFEALQGVEVIIDTTNAGTTKRAEATAFFTEVAGQLQATGAAQGVSLSGRVVHRGIGAGAGLRLLRGEAGPGGGIRRRAASGQPRPGDPVPRVSRPDPLPCRPGSICPGADHAHSTGRRPRGGRSPRRDRGRAHHDDRRDRRARGGGPGLAGSRPSSAHAGLEGWWCRSRSRAVPERPCAAAVSSRRPGHASSVRRLRSGWKEKIWRPCPRESCESPRQFRARAGRGRNGSLGRRCRWR